MQILKRLYLKTHSVFRGNNDVISYQALHDWAIKDRKKYYEQKSYKSGITSEE